MKELNNENERMFERGANFLFFFESQRVDIVVRRERWGGCALLFDVEQTIHKSSD